MTEQEANEKIQEVFDQNKEEFEKGFLQSLWGTEAYSIDRETGKIKLLTQEELLDMKEHPENYVLVSEEYHSPEEIIKAFSDAIKEQKDIPYDIRSVVDEHFFDVL